MIQLLQTLLVLLQRLPNQIYKCKYQHDGSPVRYIFNFIFLQKLSFIFSGDKATLIFRPVILYTKMQKKKGNFTLLAVRRTENTRQSSFSSFVKFVSLKSLIFIIISTVASTWSRVCFTPHTHRKTSTLSKRPFPPSILLSFVRRGNFFFPLLDLIIPSSTSQ